MKLAFSFKAVLIAAFFSTTVHANSSHYSCSVERFNAINATFSNNVDSVISEVEAGLGHRIGLDNEGRLWICPDEFTLQNLDNPKCASDEGLFQRTWASPVLLKVGVHFDKAIYLRNCKSIMFASLRNGN